jgi:hypothetical protein
MTTVQDGPAPTSTTIQQDQVEAVAEGEVVSRREAPRRVQVDHPPSRIISDINEAPRHIQVDQPPSESSVTSMNVRHGQGLGMFLTLLIQILLLPLSRKTLDTPSLILIE